MSRPLRNAPGGLVYHVLNRSIERMRIFREDADYAQFERALMAATAHVDMRLLAYCVMPNHWHLVLWPRRDGDLSRFMARLTHRHAIGWREARGSLGVGHVYQGRFKSIPVQSDSHLLTLCRYVERNPLRAGLVE